MSAIQPITEAQRGMLPVLGMVPGRGVEPERSGPVVLELEGVTKRYARGASPAVNGIDLTVRKGEVMAIIGESGCGKTTLLRMVAGLEIPEAGEIRIGGRTVVSPRAWIPPERRGVGMVFQDFALFPHMTAQENIVYGLPQGSRATRRRRAGEMLELVGLTGYEGRFPHQLSGGQQQRVALARALAPEPELILLDEPFSSLDTALKRTLREEISDILRRTGTTALLVVHDAEDVLVLADRAAVMRQGKILQEGDPETLYRRPGDEYVARFFGETNVLSGRACVGGFETALGLVPCAAAATCQGAVRLCLRPEDLQLVSGAESGQPAIVQRIRTVGIRRRVLVRLENGASPGASITIDAPATMMLAPGDRVFVRPRPEAVHVLRAE